MKNLKKFIVEIIDMEFHFLRSYLDKWFANFLNWRSKKVKKVDRDTVLVKKIIVSKANLRHMKKERKNAHAI